MHDTVVVYLLKHFLVSEIKRKRKSQFQEGRKTEGNKREKTGINVKVYNPN